MSAHSAFHREDAPVPDLPPGQRSVLREAQRQLRLARSASVTPPVLLYDRCWLRLQLLNLDELLERLPPDCSAEAPELARYRQWLAAGLQDWQALELCWQEYGAAACHQALRLHWQHQDQGGALWTLASYQQLLGSYRDRLCSGHPRALPLLVLERRQNGHCGRPQSLHWLANEAEVPGTSMRHTCP